MSYPLATLPNPDSPTIHFTNSYVIFGWGIEEQVFVRLAVLQVSPRTDYRFMSEAYACFKELYSGNLFDMYVWANKRLKPAWPHARILQFRKISKTLSVISTFLKSELIEPMIVDSCTVVYLYFIYQSISNTILQITYLYTFELISIIEYYLLYELIIYMLHISFRNI